MSLFTSEPPSDPRGATLQLCRTPASKPLRAICTSDQIIGCPTHYWHGRTVPCFQPSCTPCLEGMPWRWHGWLGAYLTQAHQHVLFEMTAQATEAFKSYRRSNGSLRGALFEASRPSKQANGRLLVRLKAADLSGVSLPDAPNVMAVLSILWNISLEEMETGRLTKQLPSCQVQEPADYSAVGANGQGLNDRHAS